MNTHLTDVKETKKRENLTSYGNPRATNHELELTPFFECFQYGDLDLVDLFVGSEGVH